MSNTTIAPANNNGAQQAEKVTTKVLNQISALMTNGRLNLPEDYSVGNALNSAWLVLQTIQDKDQKPVFKNGQLTSIVTLNSVVNALHSMVIQGLNVDKKQGYFIVYGDQLLFQRSYFGDIAIVKRLIPGSTPYGDVIYKGDSFATAKVRNRYGFIDVVARHEKPFPRETKEIVAAYFGATITDPLTGEIVDMGIELMEMDEIKKSWAKSKTINSGKSFHHDQPDQACLRTVSRRWSKRIINTSSDAMLLQAIRQSDEDVALAESNDEALELGNGQLINVEEPQALEPNSEATPPPDEPVTAKQAELVEEPGF